LITVVVLTDAPHWLYSIRRVRRFISKSLVLSI